MEKFRSRNVVDSSSNPLPASQHSKAGGAPARAPGPDDRALLERVQQRDSSAMAVVFDRYSGMAYSIALRVLDSPAHAEDVVQDVFFQIWRNPRSFAPERGSLGAWLAVVVRNRCVDALRRRKPSDPVEDVVLPSSANVASEVEHRLVMERVRSALGNLPREQRESLELAFFRGMTHAEIAQEKGEPLGTVKTRIRSALISLRRAFQP